jgi:hypothetical protein
MRNMLLAVIVCLLLAGAVLADSWNDKKGDNGKENTNVEEKASGLQGKASGSAWDKYQQAREKYAESMQKFKEKQEQSRESALDRGKNYVSNAASMLKGMLSAAEEKVSDSRRLGQDEKDAYLVGLKQREYQLDLISYSLGNATTAKELTEQAKLLKKEWKDSREAARIALGGVGVRVLDEAISAGWKAAQKADELTSQCNQSGFDVSGSGSHLAQLEEQLTLAGEDNALANQSFLNQTQNATGGYAHLKDVQNHLIEAKKISNELKNDLRTCVLKRGHVALVGSGWLFAQGSGHAEISGNGTVEANFTGNFRSGKVTVIDRAGDASITVQGGNEVKNSNETKTDSKFVTVRVWTGPESVKISGSRFTVILNGHELQLYAKGNGIAILQGSGNYSAGSDGNATASRNGAWGGNGAVAVKIKKED